MKLAVYEYQLRLSVRSSVTGYANAVELYLKKILFGEDAVKVSSNVDHVIEVDPLLTRKPLPRFLASFRLIGSASLRSLNTKIRSLPASKVSRKPKNKQNNFNLGTINYGSASGLRT